MSTLEVELVKLIENGYCYFGAGGALGFDTVAAQTVLHLKEKYPHIKLILVLPCVDQAKSWSYEDKVVYTNYTSNNDATCTADGTKTASCDYDCGATDTLADVGSKIPHKYTNYGLVTIKDVTRLTEYLEDNTVEIF